MAITKVYLFIAIIMLLMLSPARYAAAESNALSASGDLQSIAQGLIDPNFQKKSEVIESIARSNALQALPLLKVLLAGNLYYQPTPLQLVSVVDQQGQPLATDMLTGQVLVAYNADAFKKITVNNRLRGQLRAVIAQLSLRHQDAAVRLNAVNEMMKNFDGGNEALLRAALQNEPEARVREALAVAVAMVDLNSRDQTRRLTAITTLGGNVQAEVKTKLLALIEKRSDGQFVEADERVRLAAESALKRIETKLSYYSFIENLFFGLSLGSVLLLAAIGLAITFGVMGVINMAHGELMMIGAYTTYVVQLLMPHQIDISIFVAIPAAFLVAALFGIAIERGVIRYLYGRPLETLLATFGISLVLQQLVRTVFSPLNRSVETPSWMSGALEINSALALTYNRLYIIGFSLLVFVALLLLLKKTVFGLQMRAVMQNRTMAKAMGVRSGWIDSLTFGLGSGIAGVAGVALSQLTNVGPNLGQAYIIDSFMVVVFGGVGNLWGTLVGAFSLGVINKFLEPWAGAVLAKILVLVFIILFIQKRPRGLFPQKGRAAEH